MKQFIFFITCLIITFTSAAQNGQWTSLFDGKTLKGWVQRGGKATYKVENGVIIGTSVADTPNSFLCTEKNYDDFILELELTVDDGLNSGIQIRSQSKADFENGRVHGWQIEIDPSARAWSGGIYDEARRGWLYIPSINPAGQKAFKNKEQWNKYRIEAIGNTCRTWINGVPVAYLVDTLKETGFIALQVHSINKPEDVGRKVRWRNIRIQTGKNLKASPLDDTPVQNMELNTLTDQEKKQGWKLLFNGNDLSGWHTAFKTTAPTEGWSVTDGILKIQGSDGSESRSYGDILSNEKFKAFELSFEFKLTEGANSGIKYFVNEQYDSKGGSAIGLEYQLLDDAKHPDAKEGVVGNRTLASLYDLIPSTKVEARFQRKIGEWNYGRIVVRPDNVVQHWLNGFKVVEYERGSNIYRALVARSKYAQWGEGFGMMERGPILLQDHGNTVYFKNVKIRELK
ncbi:MAG: DUF1080 domain-containing protein [Saprospiraceae bacterium]